MGARVRCLLLLLTASALPGQILIRQLHVQGNRRLKEPAILAASGLHLNARVSAADLNSAGQRLFDTGLFMGVNYKYAPLGADSASGQSVTLIVSEEAAPAAVVLDIPGFDAAAFWRDLTPEASLLARAIPATAAAASFYVKSIEAALAGSGRVERLTSDDESDLATHAATVVIRPENRPAVADIAFRGNASIAAPVLRERILKQTVGNAFSEREYRRILESNIQPLLEEKGLLQATFPAIETEKTSDGRVTVLASVDEGRVWRLGQVTLEGDNLPIERMAGEAHFASGRTANWKEFLAAVSSAESVMRRQGYLSIESEPVRTFDAAAGTVHVTVKVRKGPQFHFCFAGTLRGWRTRSAPKQSAYGS